LAVAARSATFGQTGPRVGSSPVTGATNVMGIQIGEKKAKELAMLCRRYSAEQALEMGLVNAVVDDDALVATVEAWVTSWRRSALATSRSPRSAPISGGTRRATRSSPGWAC
jgi:1,4-dihydroxy-2-naphthoyl-CoA synthase